MDRRHRIDLLLTVLTFAALVAGGVLVFAGRNDGANLIWLGASGLVFIAALADTVAAALRRQAGIDLIALVAIGGAAALGESLTAAVIALMLGTGRVLEDFAERRAEGEMSALLKKVPRFANRYERDGIVRIALDAIAPGDRLLVRAGETVPADGTLLSEQAALDESALTGEPLPVSRRAGERLQSGAVNAASAFDMLATQPAAQSALASIVRLVEGARRSKAPAARLADRYALLFVPLTLVLAGGAWLWSGDPIRALAVVVVATPCPLILAVPVAIVGAMSRCAGQGVLVKHGGAIERLAQGTILFFDKTGTLTGGQARLAAVAAAPGADPDETLRLAASLDQMSDHVVARAVVQAARERGLALSLPADAVEQAGAGIAGSVDGHRVRVGNLAYVTGTENGNAADVANEPWVRLFARRAGYEGAAGVYVSIDGRLAGALQLADEIRSDTPRALRLLRAAGIRRIAMLTGDRKDVADTIGDALGVDQVFAQQTPQDKLDAIADARAKGVTLMVGDGINDAPALAAADVGIAMGARGAAAAAEAAQVVLLVDRLDRLAFALRIAHAARRIALQSVLAGMGLSIAAMIAAAFGAIAPLAGALLQEGIDVAVILNALRVLRLERGRRRISEEQVRGLQEEHHAIAPLIEQIGRLADALPGLAPETLRVQLRTLLAGLHGTVLPHERQDDAALYPQIAGIIGGEDPMAAMNHTHREIYRLVRVLDRIAAQLETSAPGETELRELHRTLYALDAILRMHFAQEEELYRNLA